MDLALNSIRKWLANPKTLVPRLQPEAFLGISVITVALRVHMHMTDDDIFALAAYIAKSDDMKSS